ncbi:Conserved_hypothetical protein [Hexamita inflata]|uniref:Uncharacterized protein n=1 Tax=Hexamita inflata TaxID=28002 RepID=A0AA86QUT1_9EUKA|nr:Conserved hypothetical protein [Hexamita inflata]CAI9961142.1 Conserved hypothetical protein [Hexamita inflata]
MTDEQFTQAFIKSIEQVTNTTYYSNETAFYAWQKLLEKQKNGLWVEVGNKCGISGKQAHDRFHNKWSKQFYDDIAPFKTEIKNIIYQGQKDNSNISITQIVQRVQESFPGQNFHYQTLYQFINYQIKREKATVTSHEMNQIEKLIAPPSFIEETSHSDFVPQLFSIQKMNCTTLDGSDAVNKRREYSLEEKDIQQLEKLLSRWDAIQQ